MSDFDAYADWLKIPADRRPPTHYDLLGLAQAEADADRIYRAAMDRMGLVRRYHLGARAADALRLQNEISRALDCLRDPDQKRRYDEQLVSKTIGGQTIDGRFESTSVDMQAVGLTRPDIGLQPLRPVDPLDNPGPAAASTGGVRLASKPARIAPERNTRPIWQRPWLVVSSAAAVVLLAGLMGVLALNSNRKKTADDTTELASPANLVTLKRQFAEGTDFRSRRSRKIRRTLTVDGRDIPTKVDIELVAHATYGKQDAEKNVPAQSKIESVTGNFSTQGTSLAYDSARPGKEASNPKLREIGDQFRKLDGRVVNYTVSLETNKIVSVEVPTGETPVNLDSIKNDYQQKLDMFPATPLKTGDKWQQTVREDLGLGHVYTFKRNYEYVGEVSEFAILAGGRKLDKITATDSSVADSNNASRGMGPRVKSSELKVESSKHTYLFDREAGRLVDADSEVRISGNLVISTNNVARHAVLDLTVTTREEELK
ncbi:MAG TPA: hypothetical protein VG826_12590 [Pirellulales bacterium]|nr:hypothetical protein [Pirellulales bacterium]